MNTLWTKEKNGLIRAVHKDGTILCTATTWSKLFEVLVTFGINLGSYTEYRSCEEDGKLTCWHKNV